MCASYAPDELTDDSRDEVAWLQGAFLSTLFCGVQITLSTMSFRAVLKQRLHRQLRLALLVYISLLCALMTTGQQCHLVFIQMGFIEMRNYPGGPNEFLSDRYRTPIDIASTCLYMLASWMMESLLVWRCKVVYETGDRTVWVGVLVPYVLLVSEFGMGILYVYEMLWGKHLMRYELAYMSLSLLLNITVTAMIVGRLLCHRQRMVRQFGPGHGSNYASAATILIESASIFTGFLVLFIVLSCAGGTEGGPNTLGQMVAHIESIASLLIIYRIARGKGWRNDVGVSSIEWRGDAGPRVEPEMLNLGTGIVAGPAGENVHAPASISKGDEAAPISVCSIDATLAQDDAV